MLHDETLYEFRLLKAPLPCRSIEVSGESRAQYTLSCIKASGTLS